MPTIEKRRRDGGTVYRARVRIDGHDASKTFRTLEAARRWAREREGKSPAEWPAERGPGVLLEDAIDGYERAVAARRVRNGRPLGKSFSHGLARLRREHGLEPLHRLDRDFWVRHVEKRLARDDVEPQTAVSELAYAGTVLRWAKGERMGGDPTAPGEARRFLRDERHLRVNSRERTARLSDEKIAAIHDWLAATEARTYAPLVDAFDFLLATSMRLGEVCRLEWSDVDESRRVVTVRHRKHPRDADRTDEVPLMTPRDGWPARDPLAILRGRPRDFPQPFTVEPNTLQFWFRRARRALGIPEFSAHLLRHESLSRFAAMRGLDVLRLQVIGGHRDIRNLRRYAKIDASTLAQS